MTHEEALSLARLQLMALESGRVLPGRCLLSTLASGGATVLQDLDGQDIMLRVSLVREDGEGAGYADVAIVPDFGTVLYSVVRGASWDEARIRAETVAAGLPGDGPFVAYEYPRVGLEVERHGEVRRVREWMSGQVATIPGEVPEGRRTGAYSLLGSFSPALRRANAEALEALIAGLGPLSLAQEKAEAPSPNGTLVELKYSKCPESHLCFELRKENAVWCVPASVEMLLAFYRYEYSEQDIACVLGQTDVLVGKIELIWGDEFKVCEAILTLTAGALKPRLYPRAIWKAVKHEISCDRPLILFSGGHARVVTGFSSIVIGTALCEGLLLYDPLGVGVCWEKFNPSSALLLVSAELERWTPLGGATPRVCG